MDSEESRRFKKELMEYLTSRGQSNQKIPQIGGRELDFYKLYKAVCKRGGAQAVSNSKLWKEIVNEFGLPPTCTSASFTLRNHYTRFLLGYEQKYFFGREDDTELPELNPGRTRKMTKKVGANGESEEEEEENESGDDSKEESLEVKVQQTQANSMIQQLNQVYSKVDKKEEIFFVKRNKLYPQINDVKRMMLAFESRIQEEIAFALNTLLLYTANNHIQFCLDQCNSLLENFTTYLEDCMKNVPCLANIFQFQEISQKQDEIQSNEDAPPKTQNFIQTLNTLDNYNYSVHDIIKFNERKSVSASPIALLKKRKREGIDQFYQQCSEVQLLEQLRTMFLILRNCCLIQQNESSITKNERLTSIIINTFVFKCDKELSKYSLDILSQISKHLQLSNIPEYKTFCLKLFEILDSESNEELESVVDTLRNLIAIQENEIIFEQLLHYYVESVTRLLLYSNGEIREGILEFLCYLSDLRMSTRISLAKQPRLILRLVALLASGIGKSNDKIMKLAGLTISNISIPPSSKKYLAPYQKDLFVLIASDEYIAKLLINIVSELDTAQVEGDEISD